MAKFKQLLAYWDYGNTGWFDADNSRRPSASMYFQMQLENARQLDQLDNLIVATNFKCELPPGVTHVYLERSEVPRFRGYTATKTLAMCELIEQGALAADECCWIHDLDVFQDVKEYPEMNGYSLAMPHASWRVGQDVKACSCNSMYFKASALETLHTWKAAIENKAVPGKQEENVLNVLNGTQALQQGEDYAALNMRYGYNFKPHWRRRKEDWRHVTKTIEWPIVAVDFNYAPMHHLRQWRRCNITPRLKALIGTYQKYK